MAENHWRKGEFLMTADQSQPDLDAIMHSSQRSQSGLKSILVLPLPKRYGTPSCFGLLEGDSQDEFART